MLTTHASYFLFLLVLQLFPLKLRWIIKLWRNIVFERILTIYVLWTCVAYQITRKRCAMNSSYFRWTISRLRKVSSLSCCQFHYPTSIAGTQKLRRILKLLFFLKTIVREEASDRLCFSGAVSGSHRLPLQGDWICHSDLIDSLCCCKCLKRSLLSPIQYLPVWKRVSCMVLW